MVHFSGRAVVGDSEGGAGRRQLGQPGLRVVRTALWWRSWGRRRVGHIGRREQRVQ